jgi:hypothetical protein
MYQISIRRNIFKRTAILKKTLFATGTKSKEKHRQTT